jgi:hypothetical protein
MTTTSSSRSESSAGLSAAGLAATPTLTEPQPSLPGSGAVGRTGRVDPDRIATVVLVVAATLFVVWNVRPWAWFLDTTPTGGDLGAHVWAPAFLRDSLLPDLRLTGWSPDWYAGFPAFTFYMVVPSLLIVMVNVGLDVEIGVIALLAAGLAGHEWARGAGLDLVARIAAAVGGVAIGVVLRSLDGSGYDLPAMSQFDVPAGTVDVVLAAIVLPTVLAAAAWSRLGDHPTLRLPVSAGLALVAILVVPVPYGIAIKLVVIVGTVLLPVCAYLMGRLGGLRRPGPALLAVGTLPFIFDMSFNIYGGNLMSTMAGEFAYSLGLAFAVLTVGVVARGLETGRHRVLGAVLLALTGLTHLFSAFFALVAICGLVLVRPGRKRINHLLVLGPLAAALSTWWVLPFWWNRAYLNDMGWGKETRYVSSLWSRTDLQYGFLTNNPTFQIFAVLAVTGVVISFWRGVRLGLALAFVGVVFAVGFVLLPEGRLWNVRLLPFYYLAVYLLAAVAVAEMARWAGELVARSSGAELRRTGIVTSSIAVGSAIVVIVMVGLPLRFLPGGGVGSAGAFEWGPLSANQYNLGGFWVEYNFEGYEQKGASDAGGGTTEYRDLVATMAKVGEEYGCGRSLWEYEAGRLGTYGTTMAPMLLPHWTTGCIGSMEGLYFEASATTPFHFLLQSELSASPSRAQRDLNYSPLDVKAGVDHLQLMGVRYYMAFSPTAIEQARANPELTEIAASGPWVVFLVSDSDLVVGLDHLPVVYTDVGQGQDDWLEPAVEYWENSETLPLRAASGPDDWPRAAADETAPKLAVEPVEILSTRRADRSISFTVDRVGTPVLVRASYFPNWSVSGADGPYRVTPNLMVVVPTDTEVELTYGRSPIELVAAGVTVVGLLAAVIVARRPDPDPGPAWWDLGARADRVDPAPVVDGAVSWERILPGGLGPIPDTDDHRDR